MHYLQLLNRIPIAISLEKLNHWEHTTHLIGYLNFHLHENSNVMGINQKKKFI